MAPPGYFGLDYRGMITFQWVPTLPTAARTALHPQEGRIWGAGSQLSGRKLRERTVFTGGRSEAKHWHRERESSLLLQCHRIYGDMGSWTLLLVCYKIVLLIGGRYEHDVGSGYFGSLSLMFYFGYGIFLSQLSRGAIDHWATAHGTLVASPGPIRGELDITICEWISVLKKIVALYFVIMFLKTHKNHIFHFYLFYAEHYDFSLSF